MHSLTIWLVPSDAIRAQTLRMLRTPGELLHDELRTVLGDVVVLMPPLTITADEVERMIDAVVGAIGDLTDQPV